MARSAAIIRGMDVAAGVRRRAGGGHDVGEPALPAPLRVRGSEGRSAGAGGAQADGMLGAIPLPASVQHIVCGERFDESVDPLASLPQLRTLTFHGTYDEYRELAPFNRPVDLTRSSSLQVVRMAYGFSSTLRLPPSLTELHIKEKGFPHPLDLRSATRLREVSAPGYKGQLLLSPQAPLSQIDLGSDRSFSLGSRELFLHKDYNRSEVFDWLDRLQPSILRLDSAEFEHCTAMSLPASVCVLQCTPKDGLQMKALCRYLHQAPHVTKLLLPRLSAECVQVLELPASVRFVSLYDCDNLFHLRPQALGTAELSICWPTDEAKEIAAEIAEHDSKTMKPSSISSAESKPLKDDCGMTDEDWARCLQVAVLTGITTLDLRFMRMRSMFEVDLSVLPAANLGMIRTLDLSSNGLRCLPACIGQLPALERLDVSYNDLSTLPVQLALMKPLRWLCANRNPLADSQIALLASQSCMGPNAESALLQYLRDLHTHSVPSKRLRLVTVGHMRAGKSTLVKALASDARRFFPGDVASLDRTPEVSFSSHVDQHGIKWQCMDMPGQPEYFPTSAHFLAVPRAIILLVIDAHRALGGAQMQWSALKEECRLWLGMIEQLAKQRGSSKVVTGIVLTHCDKLASKDRALLHENWQLIFMGLMGTAAAAHPAAPAASASACVSSSVYPHAGLQWSVLLKNARSINEVDRCLYTPWLYPTARSMLDGQVSPGYLEKVLERLEALRATPARAAVFLPCVTRAEAQELLCSPLGLHFEEAATAISLLVSVGELLELSDGRVVLSLDWFSHLLAALVKPAGAPFRGIETQRGVVTLHDLRAYLLRENCGITSTNLEDRLAVLHSLDVLVPLQQHGAGEHHSKSILPTVSGGHLTHVWIPSRMENDAPALFPPSSCHVSYGHRLLYSDPSARFPPGLMPLLAGQLAPFIGSFAAADFSQHLLHFHGPEDAHAYLVLSKQFASLDVLAWGSDSHVVQQWLEVFVPSVEGALCNLAKAGSGVRMHAVAEQKQQPVVRGRAVTKWCSQQLQVQPLCTTCMGELVHCPAGVDNWTTSIGALVPTSALPPSSPRGAASAQPAAAAPTYTVFQCSRHPKHRDVSVHRGGGFSVAAAGDDGSAVAGAFVPLRALACKSLGEVPLSGLDVRAWSRMQVREWFVQLHPLHGSFLDRTHEGRSWNGATVLRIASEASERMRVEEQLRRHSAFPLLQEQVAYALTFLADCQERFDQCARLDERAAQAPGAAGHASAAALPGGHAKELAELKRLMGRLMEQSREFHSASAAAHEVTQRALQEQTAVLLQADLLLPRLFVLQPKEWASRWEAFTDFSALKQSFELSFVCEVALMRAEQGAGGSGQPRTHDSPCSQLPAGYTVCLTRESLVSYLPWLQRGMQLLRVLVSAVPMFGGAASSLLNLSLPASLVSLTEHKDSVLAGLDAAMAAAEVLQGTAVHGGKGSANGQAASNSAHNRPELQSLLLTGAHARVLATELSRSPERAADLQRLSQFDTAMSFGGLHLRQCRDGRYRWLCPHHHHQEDETAHLHRDSRE